MTFHGWTALIALCALLSPAIAGEPIPDVKLFALPKAELKQRPFTSDSPGAPGQLVAILENPARESGPSGTSATISKGEFSVSSESGLAITESSIQSFETMNGGPVLTQLPRPTELGGAAGWVQKKVWEPVFVPEVVKLGKVHVTGGIVTAIKRRNPFCLLHPLVFAASW